MLKKLWLTIFCHDEVALNAKIPNFSENDFFQIFQIFGRRCGEF